MLTIFLFMLHLILFFLLAKTDGPVLACQTSESTFIFLNLELGTSNFSRSLLALLQYLDEELSFSIYFFTINAVGCLDQENVSNSTCFKISSKAKVSPNALISAYWSNIKIPPVTSLSQKKEEPF